MDPVILCLSLWATSLKATSLKATLLGVLDVMSLVTADAREWVAGRYRVVVMGEPFGEDARSVGDHVDGTLPGRDVADDRTGGNSAPSTRSVTGMKLPLAATVSFCVFNA